MKFAVDHSVMNFCYLCWSDDRMREKTTDELLQFRRGMFDELRSIRDVQLSGRQPDMSFSLYPHLDLYLSIGGGKSVDILIPMDIHSHR